MIKKESLTHENMIEDYNAADYFQLTYLQDLIMKTVKNGLEKNSPELLHLQKIISFLTYLATIPLNIIEFGRLSISALQLSCSHKNEKPFVTQKMKSFVMVPFL